MAKKKDFSNIVDESFEEGYKSEPEAPSVPAQPKEAAPIQENPTEEPENLSEEEILLRKILAGDQEVLESMWGREDRSTYYLTDLHRACIDVMSHEEGMKKNEIVVNALNNYFSKEVKQTAKELVVSRAVKSLEKEIHKKK